MSQHLRISGFSARSMCPIHVLAFMSQHLCISGSSARSMSPDPCLNIHIYLRNLCKIHVSGCLNIHIYLRSFCKIHVSDACRIASLSSDFVALRRRNANFDRLRRVLRGPAQGKQSGRDPRERAPETRFLWPCAGKTVRPRSAGASSGDAFSVALRKENSPTECFAQAKRKFSTAEMHFLWPCACETQILTSGDASSVQMKWIHEESQPDEQNRHGATARAEKKFPSRSFAQAKRKF